MLGLACIFAPNIQTGPIPILFDCSFCFCYSVVPTGSLVICGSVRGLFCGSINGSFRGCLRFFAVRLITLCYVFVTEDFLSLLVLLLSFLLGFFRIFRFRTSSLDFSLLFEFTPPSKFLTSKKKIKIEFGEKRERKRAAKLKRLRRVFSFSSAGPP